MIVFAGDTFHAGVSSYGRRDGNYPSNLRLFSYIVEKDYLSENEDITTLKTSMLCSNSCPTCYNIPKEIMYYPGKVIKYALSSSKIETLDEGTVLMGNLEKIGWVVLKSGYNIIPCSDLENQLYIINNDDHREWFAIDGKQRQMYYKQSKNNHDSRFIENNIMQLHDLFKKIVIQSFIIWKCFTILIVKKGTSTITQI